MKNLKLLMMIGLTMVIFQFCRPSGNPKVPVDTTIDEHLQEAMFIQRTALDGMKAIALGKLAAEKAIQPELKDYGAKMSTDYQKINDSLKVLANSKAVVFPSSLPLEEQNRIQELRKMEVDYFQKLYLKIMIEGLRKDIVLFKSAKKAPDSAIVNFVNKNLPVLEQQLQKVLSLH